MNGKFKYTIVTALSSEELEIKVTEKISDGWLPHGGVSVTVWCETWKNEHEYENENETRICKQTLFAQAMKFVYGVHTMSDILKA